MPKSFFEDDEPTTVDALARKAHSLGASTVARLHRGNLAGVAAAAAQLEDIARQLRKAVSASQVTPTDSTEAQ